MRGIELYPEHTLRGRPLIVRILREFHEQTGATAFYYWDLRKWYYGTDAHLRYQRDWHTIERLVRKAVEWGLLQRAEEGRRRVKFIITIPERVVVKI